MYELFSGKERECEVRRGKRVEEEGGERTA